MNVVQAVPNAFSRKKEKISMFSAADDPAMAISPSLFTEDCSMMFETEKTTP